MSTLQQILAVIRTFDDEMPSPVEEIVSLIGLGPNFVSLPEEVSGKIVRVADNVGYRIEVNKNHHPNRQRFTLAHELGHYMFHRDLLDFGVGDTLAYRAENSGTPNPKIGPREETEANRFASNLLMPNRLIERLRREGITDPCTMARKLGVSEAAMRIKLGLPPPHDLFG